MSLYSPELDADVAWPDEATSRMNRMYRRQRHIYDGTRRYYLLGRDRLIAGLQPAPGANVLEIGCGTGRNLVLAAGLYPDARFFGIDVSTEMLTSAIASVSRRGMTGRIRLAHGDGTAFDPQLLFNLPSFDHVMISYSLSMIPDWRRVLQAAVNRLTPGGRLHVVDFGNQERLPGIARALAVALARAVRCHAARRPEDRAVGDGGKQRCRTDVRTSIPRLCAICRDDIAAGPVEAVSAWLALVAAGLFEIAWAFGLKYSDGLTRFWPTAATAVAIALSFGLMAVALRSLPFGTAYVVWTGIGAVGSILVGILVYSEPADPVRLLCLTLIVAGMVGLKLNSPV